MSLLYNRLNQISYFKATLVFLFIAELLSFFAWLLPEFNLLAFIIIAVLVFVLSLKNLLWGLYIAIAELIVGSQGYLFAFNYEGISISIRIGIFMAVFFAWLISLADKHKISVYWQNLKKFKLFTPFLVLAIIILWALLWGYLRGNNFANIFFDFNNWLFFLYLFPLLDVVFIFNSERPSNHPFWYQLSQVATAALIWLIIKSFLFLYIFSHNFSWALPELYRWIRDTRVGEITQFSDNFHRVFLQSHIYTLVGFLMLWPQFIKHLKREKLKAFNKLYFVLPIFALSVIFLSFSRSLWVGLVSAMGIYFLFLIYYFYKKQISLKLQAKSLIANFFIFISICLVSIAMLFVILNLPPAKSAEDLGRLIEQRATQVEEAGSSRINMLGPIAQGIKKHPIIGSGFGATLTYRSLDPRVLQSTAGASGEYTTYAFEWGYLDMWLKFGLAGLLVYAYLIYAILKGLYHRIDINQIIHTNNSYAKGNNYNFVYLGLLLSLVALIFVNIFTPYLNHPLGIGYLLLLSVYLSYTDHATHTK